ncbi:tumor necrosis factor receptor superfamily member 14-like [Lethenteron reissneri]|uniref:tumor necrosis factor receptor superfamily member 14-like n=1 Tax=Lethenteron reissneri TaxID=7753 RepID=UPI002AB6E07C|nr:tumor necrosis factor receptor superfamily member 14-like [Lethenteron reissneri]
MALSRTPPRLIFMLAALEVRLLCGVALPAVRHGSQECCEAWDPVERSCLLCAAGCYKVGSEARDAVLCSPCPPGSFTSFPNALMHCLSCTPCLHERGLVLARNCSRDADSTCGCDSHSFCAVFSGQHCELCLRNWTCARSPETTQGSLHTEAVTRILIGVSVFALCILCITGFFTCKSCVLALRAPGR